MNPRMKVRLFAAGAVALAAVPTAAMAEGPYIGVSAGVALPEDSANAGQFDTTVPATPDWPAIPAGTPLAWNTEFDTGFAVSGQFGYAFDNGFRLELEGAFNRYGVTRHRDLAVGGANIDGLDASVLTRGTPSPANPTVGAVLAQDDSEVTNFGLFGNVFYDINTGSGFKPYIGAGLGYQWVDVEYQPSGVDVADDTDGGLAYQLMAGASYDLATNTQLFGQYTYRSLTEEAEVPLNLLPATLGVESTQSIISAGVRVSF